MAITADRPGPVACGLHGEGDGETIFQLGVLGPFIGYLPDPEDFTVGGYAATGVPRILQIPPYSPAVDDALVAGALALIERLER